MNLDLALLTTDWQPARDAIAARLVGGADGREFVQLRVDLGVLQMCLTGRPDGDRCHGLPTAVDLIGHELRRSRNVALQSWQALERELQQYHYRRLALAALAEEALAANDTAAAVRLLNGTAADIDHCLASIRLMEEHRAGGAGEHLESRPALVFNRTRIVGRALALEDRYEAAVERLETGLAELDRLLADAGYDESQRQQDPGLAYLRQTAERLRSQHGIGQTLAERLADAIAREDFKAAAHIRDLIRRRGERSRDTDA